ncbi:MAG: sugar transferase [Bacteroidota bacterium]
MKRSFDIFFALVGLLLCSPFFIAILVAILVEDPSNSPFYRQIRVGKDGKHFGLFKFRTMRPFADTEGKLTVGNADNRITRVGGFLRKYKLDELPQFLNILNGDMSFVGPRPEVPDFVQLYSEAQRRVLSVRPGLTDYASLKYINENELLGKAEDPKQYYIDVIMPDKIRLGIQYADNQSIAEDLRIIFRTLAGIVR